jgi:hypothetical protein
MKRKSSNRHSDLEDKDIKKELRKARNRMSAMAHREKKEAFENAMKEHIRFLETRLHKYEPVKQFSLDPNDHYKELSYEERMGILMPPTPTTQDMLGQTGSSTISGKDPPSTTSSSIARATPKPESKVVSVRKSCRARRPVDYTNMVNSEDSSEESAEEEAQPAVSILPSTREQAAVRHLSPKEFSTVPSNPLLVLSHRATTLAENFQKIRPEVNMLLYPVAPVEPTRQHSLCVELHLDVPLSPRNETDSAPLASAAVPVSEKVEHLTGDDVREALRSFMTATPRSPARMVNKRHARGNSCDSSDSCDSEENAPVARPEMQRLQSL